jgi:hypothetical protein
VWAGGGAGLSAWRWVIFGAVRGCERVVFWESGMGTPFALDRGSFRTGDQGVPGGGRVVLAAGGRVVLAAGGVGGGGV